MNADGINGPVDMSENPEITGIREGSFEGLVLQARTRTARHRNGPALQQPGQAALLEILAVMDELNYTPAQMKNMAATIETLLREPNSSQADRDRKRLNSFIQALSRRRVASGHQLLSRTRLTAILQDHYV